MGVERLERETRRGEDSNVGEGEGGKGRRKDRGWEERATDAMCRFGSSKTGWYVAEEGRVASVEGHRSWVGSARKGADRMESMQGGEAGS